MIKYYYHKPLLKYLFFGLDQLIFRHSRPVPQSIKKVLLVNSGGIGDVMLMEPMIRQINRLWPEAQLDILVDQPAQDLFKNHPHLNSITSFALPWLSHSRPSFHSAFKSFCSQLKFLRLANYDLAFDLKGDPAVILLLALARINYRIGFINGGLAGLLDRGYDFFAYQLPRAQLNYLLLSSFWSNWRSEPAKPIITLTEAEINQAIAGLAPQLKTDQKTIAIHLSGGQPEKIWPLDHWRALLSELSGYNLLIIGSNSDRPLLASLNNDQLIDGLGRDLRLSCALISQADLFIGADSGPGHLAAALGVPVISLFSLINDPLIWAADQAELISSLDLSAISVAEVKQLVLAKLNSSL